MKNILVIGIGSAWENNVASLRVFMATLQKKRERSRSAPIYTDPCGRGISDAADRVRLEFFSACVIMQT